MAQLLTLGRQQLKWVFRSMNVKAYRKVNTRMGLMDVTFNSDFDWRNTRFLEL